MKPSIVRPTYLRSKIHNQLVLMLIASLSFKKKFNQITRWLGSIS